MFAFAGSPAFELVIDLVSDATSFGNGLLHGKDEAGDRLIGQVVETDFFERDRSNAKATSRLAEIGQAFSSMNEDDGNVRGMAIALADHFGGGAELFGGAGDGGGRAQTAQFEFKNVGGLLLGKGDGIQFTEAVATAMVIIVFGVLVAQDAAFA